MTGWCLFSEIQSLLLMYTYSIWSGFIIETYFSPTEEPVMGTLIAERNSIEATALVLIINKELDMWHVYMFRILNYFSRKYSKLEFPIIN